MLKIYHNPRCSKSRAGLQYLTDNKVEHEVFDYLKEGLTAADIKMLAKKTAMPVEDLVRKHEDYYKKELKDKTISDEQWYEIIAENPRLLHRPIVVKNEKAVFAQPPQEIEKLK